MLLAILTKLLLQQSAMIDQKKWIDRVVASRKCKTASWDDTQLNCKYEIETAKFEIAGVGAPDAQIAIDAADPKKVWVSFMLLPQCVALKRSDAWPVWISPKNGKVYEYPESCAAAGRDGR